MKKILIFMLLLIFPLVKVNGYYCNYQDVAKYKKIASNINYSYEYIETDNDVVFKITLVNLDPSLYLKDSKSNVYYYTSSEIVVDGKSGENISFYVYPTDTFCKKESLYTIRIQLPTYNKFYKDEICKGIETYELCNKWSTHNLSYEKFTSKVISYKESLKKDEIIIEVNDEKTILDYIIKFAIDYYYVILILIIFICSTIIYIKNKKSDIYN